MNPYKILGVAKTATPQEIKAAYRRLAVEMHPDKKGGDDTEFRALTEANDILSDEKKRRDYDEAESKQPVENLTVSAQQVVAEYFQQLNQTPKPTP